MLIRSLLSVGLLFAAGPSFADDSDAAKKAREVLDKKLADYKDAQNGRVLPVTEDFVGKAFPKHHFFVLRFMQYPLARVVAEPLKSNNIFVVKPDQSVMLINDIKDLQKFFAGALAKVESGEAAEIAAKAWLRLAQELYQDSMFKFNEPSDLKVAMTKDLPPSKVEVSGVCTLDTKNGDKGQLTSTLIFEKGKLAKVTDEPKLQAGIRPICQATKLLDPDPVVRAMAEQAILVMGRSCKFYLDEQRAKASPELQKAIDRIWQRILDQDR